MWSQNGLRVAAVPQLAALQRCARFSPVPEQFWPAPDGAQRFLLAPEQYARVPGDVRRFSLVPERFAPAPVRCAPREPALPALEPEPVAL